MRCCREPIDRGTKLKCSASSWVPTRKCSGSRQDFRQFSFPAAMPHEFRCRLIMLFQLPSRYRFLVPSALNTSR